MNEHDDDFDDLASAFLDDEVTPVERERLAADPAVVGRAEELARVREQLRRAPWPAVDEVRREQALVAALAVADDGVASLTATRARRRAAATRRRFAWLTPRPALAGAVAAAAVVVALAVWAGGRDSDEPVASPATASAESTPAPTEAARDQADTATAVAGAHDEVAPPTVGAAAAASTSLGTFDTPAELRAALVPALQAEATTLQGTLEETLEAAACPAPEAGDHAVGTASYRGVLAVVFVRGDPPTKAVVVALDGCNVLDEVPLT